MMPPFAKDVRAGRLRAGHKLLLFAGRKAWNAARWYRERGDACEGRTAHVLLLPPDQAHRAAHYQWPVRGCGVVVVSTDDDAGALLPLFDALQRDGARSIEVYPCDPGVGASNLEWDLQCIHWGHAFADPLLEPAHVARAA